PSRAEAKLLVKGLTEGLAWSPGGDEIAFATRGGVGVATPDGHIRDLVSAGQGEALPVIGWSPGQSASRYQPPEQTSLIVRVSGRELEARLQLRQLSATSDQVPSWLSS